MQCPEVQINLCVALYLLIPIGICFDLNTCGPEEDPIIPGRVRLIVFTGNATDLTSSETTLTEPEAIGKNITATKRTIVYVHGFTESTTSDTVRLVVNAYLERGDVNIIAIDWSNVSKNWNYFSVCSQLPAIGKVLAIALERLSPWIDLRALHIIGHSLGAHIAGYVGKFSNVTLGRITGLDPALPAFYPGPCHVSPNDAQVVVIIHTNGGLLGTSESTGSIDFYANRGILLQPDCLIKPLPVLCSHQKSVVYYARSIANPKAFPAHRCTDTGKTAANDGIVYLSDSTPKDAHGDYCFSTNG